MRSALTTIPICNMRLRRPRGRGGQTNLLAQTSQGRLGLLTLRKLASGNQADAAICYVNSSPTIIKEQRVENA